MSKLILLAVLAGIAWYGWKAWGKKLKRMMEPDAAPTPTAPADKVAAPALAEDLVPCRICGTYVAAGTSQTCGRPECRPAGQNPA